MFRIDSAVGLGNDDFLLQDSLWSPNDYQDSLFMYIDSLRNNDQFDWVSMNTSDQLTYQAKLSWRVTPTIKFGYNRMFSNTKSQDYSHGYRWNPDGDHFLLIPVLVILSEQIYLNKSVYICKYHVFKCCKSLQNTLE